MHTLPCQARFPTTRWTIVVAAADPDWKESRSDHPCILKVLLSICKDGMAAGSAEVLPLIQFERQLRHRDFEGREAHDSSLARLLRSSNLRVRLNRL